MAVLLLPFGYQGYPADQVEAHIAASDEFVRGLGADCVCAPAIITLPDCEPAIELAKSEVWDAVIVLIATWIEAPNAMRVLASSGLESTPMLLWAHDNVYDPEEGATISFGAIAASGVMRETFEEFGYPFKFVVGNPGDETLGTEIWNFCKAAHALGMLKSQRLGMIGYASMGMYTGIADHIKVKRTFGTEIVQLDQYSLIAHVDEMESGEVLREAEALNREWAIASGVENELVNRSSAVYVRLKELVAEHKLDALTVKCQYEMSVEYGFTPCVALSILGGKMPVSCEGDVYLLLSQMILSNISGETTAYGDLLGFLEDGIVCAACGFAPKCFLATERPQIDKHTALYSGMLITTPFKPQPVTLIRLANDKNGFKLHLIKGRVEELRHFHEIGCPSYAGSVIRFENKRVEDFKQEIMSQHYAIVPGDHVHAIRDFCALVGIRIV